MDVDVRDADLLEAELATPVADRVGQSGVVGGGGVGHRQHRHGRAVGRLSIRRGPRRSPPGHEGLVGFVAMESLPLGRAHRRPSARARSPCDRVLGIPSYTLMTHAGEAAFTAVRSCWPSAQRIAVVCGPGNNGGDGYVLARVARERRLHVDAMSLADPAQLDRRRPSSP